ICERAGLGEYGPAKKKPKGQPGPAKKRPFKPAHRMYDLRHTCATLLLQSGVNVKVVSEILGHASVRITLDIYSHVLPDMQDTAVEAMEAMFRAGPKYVTNT
ncbi:MAG: tyrosine-type recombinase/integrase, partial [Longimicrobiales bacterium]